MNRNESKWLYMELDGPNAELDASKWIELDRDGSAWVERNRDGLNGLKWI
jgi:hypothetical protein